MQNLPLPSLEAQQQSLALAAHIQNICAQHANNMIPFKLFMNLALYTPGLGYYSAGAHKLGPEGDFVTAPEISPLFGQSLSSALDNILNYFPKTMHPCILELGAGTGKLAADILENLKCLPEKYFILDISADLIERQKKYLNERLPPALFQRLEWLSSLPKTPFAGIILANEVIDALPVHKIKITSDLTHPYWEYYVTYSNHQFQWQLGPPSTPHLTHFLSALFSNNINNITRDFISEINTDLHPWLNSLSKCLTQGVMLFIDYGFPAHEYYHPDRDKGTLMCHYRHRSHTDVFKYIGLSDITAHVDFTALANAGQAAHLKVRGFTNQGAYLLDNNLIHFAEKAHGISPYIISQQIQQLTQPHEMGELFKVMALAKNWDHPLTGFGLRDHRSRLGASGDGLFSKASASLTFGP